MTDAEGRLNGLPAWKQGLVNVAGKLARDDATKRLRSIGGLVPYKARGPNEYDILTDEFCLTPVYGVNEEMSPEEETTRVHVLSTLAGLEIPDGPNEHQRRSDNVVRIMNRVAFAGIAMDTVMYKPENAAHSTAKEDLALQKRGVFHDTAIGQEMRFGDLIVLRAPPCEDGHYPGASENADPDVGKARLIAQPLGDGKHFGDEMASFLGEKMWGDDAEFMDVDMMTPSELAFEEFAERLTDTILISALSLFHDLKDIDDKLKRAPGVPSRDDDSDREKRIEMISSRFFGFDDRVDGEMPNKETREARKDLMQQCLANFVMHDGPVLSPGAKYVAEEFSIFNRMRRQHMQRTFSSLLDCLRIHNQFVIGRVIRAGREKKKYYGMLDG